VEDMKTSTQRHKVEYDMAIALTAGIKMDDEGITEYRRRCIWAIRFISNILNDLEEWKEEENPND